MIEKGGVYSTKGIIYGYNPTKGGAWGLIKVFGKRKENVTQVWIKNPAQIKECESIRVVDILRAFTTRHYSKPHNQWYTNMNVDVMAMPAETSYRETADGIVTPEDDIGRFLFGIQGGKK